MKEIELTDPKEIALIQRVYEVFLVEGMKRVTMDHMSKILNVSKKTLYKYVKNRKELVMKSTIFQVERDTAKIIEIQNKELNPIHEQHELTLFFMETLSKINPIVHYDLENYFPEAWKYLTDFFGGFCYRSICENLERGQKEGVYRKDFNPAVVGRLYSSKIDVIFDGELFPSTDFNFKDVYSEYVLYHLNAIVSEEGKKILTELDFK